MLELAKCGMCREERFLHDIECLFRIADVRAAEAIKRIAVPANDQHERRLSPSRSQRCELAVIQNVEIECHSASAVSVRVTAASK